LVYKKTWKYILTKDESCYCRDFGCYRPKAIKDFSDVHKGNIGGYVQSYHNLSHKGKCWIYDYAEVLGFANISEDARIYGHAQVGGYVQISGNTWIIGKAVISGNAKISKNIIISEYNTKKNFLIKIKNWFIKRLGNIF
jgi:NDP-sugar pyrophosphorylase family protein